MIFVTVAFAIDSVIIAQHTAVGVLTTVASDEVTGAEALYSVISLLAKSVYRDTDFSARSSRKTRSTSCPKFSLPDRVNVLNSFSGAVIGEYYFFSADLSLVSLWCALELKIVSAIALILFVVDLLVLVLV